MITANQLRIGNLLHYKEEVVTVSGMYQGGCFVLRDKGSILLGIDNLKPIPLTEEWLLKFGFEQKSGREYLKGRFMYRFQQRDLIIEGFEYDYNGIICHPEYVHHLQNIYHALTGEEL